MSKTVVVLGAGLGGIPVAHWLAAKSTQTDPDLRVVLVAPNDEFFWNIASPRVVIPGAMGEDKVLYKIPAAFSKYSHDKFEFVLGKAESLHPDANSVTVALNDGTKRDIAYHTVIIATGADARDGMPWKTMGTSQQTRAAISQLRDQIEKASSIVVGGAGITGVELAGELGYNYAKSGAKSITIISADSLPLESRIMKSTRETAKKELEKLQVKVISNARISGLNDSEGGKVVELTKADSTKVELKMDLFIPAYGIKFNTEFAPPEMRDDGGRLHQDTFLRAPKYKNVFIIGDAGNLQAAQAATLGAQVEYLAKQFEAYFKDGKVEEYKPDPKIMLALSIGPSRATGQLGTWKPFSLLLWWFKARTMGTDSADDFVQGVKILKTK
ncbi:uncharacterized protein PG986_002023 [Apiospora aurea]|uniref:FAD/NAD(P)-binding domain-containing protein n=1 Tax=Apiospora aurea TaxID=335848 RepID=A0ABR1QYG7_9PEZI